MSGADIKKDQSLAAASSPGPHYLSVNLLLPVLSWHIPALCPDPGAARYPWSWSKGLLAPEERAVLSHWGRRWPGRPVQANPQSRPCLDQHAAPVQSAKFSLQSPAFPQPCPQPGWPCVASLSSHPIPKAEKAKPTVFSFIPSLALTVHAAEARLGLASSCQPVAPTQSCAALPRPAPSSWREEARLENSPLGAGKKQRRSAC